MIRWLVIIIVVLAIGTGVVAGSSGLEVAYWKDLTSAVKDGFTAAAIVIAGVWAWQKFNLFRQEEESVAITTTLGHLVRDDRFLLHLFIEVENIGAVMIKSRRCTVSITPIVGGVAIPASAQQLAREFNQAECAQHLDLIDKSEHSTFSFLASLPFTTPADRPEACQLSIVLESKKTVTGGGNLGWLREEIYLFEEPKKGRRMKVAASS
jgi:hypothetical protein